MPKTESNPIELGTRAADFLLPDAQGVLHRLTDFDAKPALLVAFISNRCPFVVLIREQLAAFARDYANKGLQVVAINANAMRRIQRRRLPASARRLKNSAIPSPTSRTLPSRRPMARPARPTSSCSMPTGGSPITASSTMRGRATANR
ncbi:redoxin domain-containing protein [Mesorhizobium sp. M0621]